MARIGNRHKVCCAFAAITIAFGTSAPCTAMAQSTDATELEEIVVTATRRVSSISDVPFNIAAIPGDTLERQRLLQLPELSREIPGLTVVDQGARSASRMTARGLNVATLNESIVLFNSSGDTVATYLGEIPVYIDYWMRDLDRVEVLLGPQGTLYGAGTLGGAIRYIPQEPDAGNWEAAVSVSGFGQSESDGVGTDFQALLNAPIVNDSLALRVSLSHYHDPGYTDYPLLLREPGVSNPQPDFSDPTDVAANLVAEEDADSGDIFNARVALKWDVSENLSGTISYVLQETDFGGRSINHRQAMGTGRYDAASRVTEPNRRENQLVSLEIRANLGFAELVSATGVSQFRELGQRDQTDLLLPLGFGFEAFPNFVNITSDSTKEERFNQELRLISTGPGPWSWIAGAFYNDFDFSHELRELAPGYADFLGTVRPDNLMSLLELEKERREAALFGEVAYAFSDQWQVTVGARRFDFEATDGLGFDLPLLLTAEGIYGPDEIGINVESFAGEDSGTLFKLNSSYRFNDDLMTYLTISEGYRLGGVNAAPRCPEVAPPVPFPCLRPNETDYDPDTTLNYEVGMRSEWFERRLTLTAAVYYIDWQDVQLDVVSEDLFFIKINGGDARSRGLELAAQAFFNDRWQASLGYAFNRAELTSAAPGIVDGADAFAGDRLAGTPEHQLSARLSYNRPLWSQWDLGLDYGVSYTGDIYTKTGLRNNGEILPAFTVHNISATFRSNDTWTVRVFIDNLFNEFAETNTRSDQSFIGDVGVHPLRLYYRNVLRPRRYGAEVRYDFDFD